MAGYKINGVDLYTSIGFVADSNRSSSDSFERPNEIKPIFTHDYGDDNGVDIDLVSPRFKQARVLRLEGYIYATSEADYKAKKSAKDALFATALLTIEADEVGVTVNATFKGTPTWNRLTKVKGETQIVTKVAFEFDEVMSIATPSYNLFYGPSSAIPVTEADVLALTQVTYVSEVTLNTGTTNRFFSLVLQSDKSIISVTDLDGGAFGNITSQYVLRGTVVVSGHTYNIYSMEVAVPYSTAHHHKIVLTAGVVVPGISVSAGPDRVLVRPATRIDIAGATATPAAGATITSYLWTLDSTVPDGLSAVLDGYNVLNPSMYGFSALGVYNYTLKVTDSNGNIATDTMKITVTT